MTAAGLLAAVVAVAAWRRIGWRNGLRRVVETLRAAPLGILLQYLIWYCAMLGVTLFLVDATTPIDQRIISPAYTTLLVLVVVWLATWGERGMRAWAAAAAVALLCALVVSYGLRTALGVPSLRLEQRGFTNPGWVSAGSLDAIRDLPPGILIYTNNLEALEFFYQRGGTIIPFSIDAVTRLPVESYERWLAEMRERLQAGTAVLILFDRRADDVELPRALIEGTDLWYEQHEVRIYVGAGGAQRLGDAPQTQ
jgi:hypothetical protein